MRPPRFWHRPAGLASALLAPFGALYAAATARRLRSGPREVLSVPIICVGNINAGGTGKTPTVIALVERLKGMGAAPHVVSRGYGGSFVGPVQVSESTHDAAQTGDEPLLIAAFAPTWVSKNRRDGAQAAIDAGADVVILDDGFQNPALAYDVSIVVVDAVQGFGNGKVMPAGPLREPVTAGLARADAVLSIGPLNAQHSFTTANEQDVKVPHLTGHLKPLRTGISWDGLNVLAFAGIGNPEKFFATLRGLGATVVKSEALDDHQPLSVALMKRLQVEARAMNAQLVTTEKDAVRLPDAFRREVLTLPVRLEIDDWSALDLLLEKSITARRQSSP